MLRERDEGFTLIELMVGVLIVGILIAIAIPTFLGARTRAQDRAAQSALRIAVTNAKAIFTDNSSYADATVNAVCNNANVYAGKLACAEPNLTFSPNDAVSTNDRIVSVKAPSKDAFVAAVLSASLECWYLRDAFPPESAPGTFWAKRVSDGSGTNCSADYVTAGGGGSTVAWTGNTPGAATTAP